MIADAIQKHIRPTPKLPRIIATSLALVGVAAGTMVAAFRSGQPDVQDATGKKEAAKDPQPELTQEQTADYQALAGMIQGYIGEGQYANALASVETLLSTYPQSRSQPAYSIARAMALRGLSRIEEAKVELRKEVHLFPQIPALANDPRHSAFKALLLQRLWRDDDANQELSRPCNADLDPNGRGSSKTPGCSGDDDVLHGGHPRQSCLWRRVETAVSHLQKAQAAIKTSPALV